MSELMPVQAGQLCSESTIVMSRQSRVWCGGKDGLGGWGGRSRRRIAAENYSSCAAIEKSESIHTKLCDALHIADPIGCSCDPE